MGRRSETTQLLRATGASKMARERMTVMLLTLSGEWSVKDGLERLHLSRTQFQNLRNRMLSQALWELEKGRPGRPRKGRTVESETEHELRHQLTSLERELRMVQTSLELAQSEAGDAVCRHLLAKARSKKRRRR